MIHKLKRTIVAGITVCGVKGTLEVAIEVLNIIFADNGQGIRQKLGKVLLGMRRKSSKLRLNKLNKAKKEKSGSKGKCLAKNLAKRSMTKISASTLKAVQLAKELSIRCFSALLGKLKHLGHNLKFKVGTGLRQLGKRGKEYLNELWQEQSAKPAPQTKRTRKSTSYCPFAYFHETVTKNSLSIQQALEYNYKLFESVSSANHKLITDLYERKLSQWHLYTTGLHLRFYYTTNSFVDLSIIFKLLAGLFASEEEDLSYLNDSVKARDSYDMGTSCHSFLSAS